MAADLYVPDANVFLEYMYDRSLQDHARQIIHDAVLDRIQLVVPSLLLDEITEVLCGNMNDREEVKLHIQYLETLTKGGDSQYCYPGQHGADESDCNRKNRKPEERLSRADRQPVSCLGRPQ